MYPPWPVYNCQVFLTNKGLIFHWDQWFGCMSVLIMNMLWQKWVCIVVYIWSVAQTQQAQTQHTEYWCCLPNIMWYFTKMPDSFWLKLNVLCILTTLALVHTAKSIQKKNTDYSCSTLKHWPQHPANCSLSLEMFPWLMALEVKTRFYIINPQALSLKVAPIAKSVQRS